MNYRPRFLAVGLLRLTGLSLFLSIVMAGNAFAAEAFFRVPVNELEFLDGAAAPGPDTAPGLVFNQRLAALTKPLIVLEGAGEAYLHRAAANTGRQDGWVSWEVVAKSGAGQDVVGRLYRVDSSARPAPPFRFRISAAKASAVHRVEYLRARANHYDLLAAQGLSGSAWFRHQALASAAELNIAAPNSPRVLARANRIAVDRTLDLLTGQRAISENLALDRLADGASVGRATVGVDALRGITVAEIDWKPLLPADPPELDRLAAMIPADQHAVFLPSFGALTALVDRYQRIDATILQAIIPPRQEYDVLRRYQDQMGVSLDAGARLVGGALVQSVAITGGDPYFVTGTDVAIVFETKQPTLLREALLASMRESLAAVPGVAARDAVAGGVAYTGWATEDRRASGYVAAFPQAVVVTNSVGQIERLAAVQRDPAKSLARLDEFHFFRHRYRLGEPGETAFFFMSDATIRRWCGARWRIGAMRRARALAEVADLQASIVPELVQGKITPREIETPLTSVALGTVRVEGRGIRSAIYNTMEFATPIAELPLDLVTSFEAEAYERWRVDYERGWRWAFDPIGLRLLMKDGQLVADLSILPLIANTQYRDLINLTRGATIPPGAGDRHGALLHAVLALSRQSSWIGTLEGIARNTLKSDVLSWLGPTASIYVDASPLWDDLRKAMQQLSPSELQQWQKDNAHRLPLALCIDVTNRDKADEFLKSLRQFLEPALGTYAAWETRKHRDQVYTRVVATDEGAKVLSERFALHVANLGDSIVFAIAEETLHKAIDRRLDRPVRAAVGADAGAPAKTAKTGATVEPTDPLAGRNVGLDLEGESLSILGRLGNLGQMALLQQQSWENLFILNEWKRIAPERDPVELHEKLWGERLVCPAGGKYVWNAALQSLESTALGHPFQPRFPPPAMHRALPFERASFQLTFEHQGLRVEARLQEKKPE